MTTAPAAASRGAISLDDVAPDEASAMSMPLKSAVAESSTSMGWPNQSNVVPADRDDPKKRISSTGKFRSRKMARMTVPT